MTRGPEGPEEGTAAVGGPGQHGGSASDWRCPSPGSVVIVAMGYGKRYAATDPARQQREGR